MASQGAAATSRLAQMQMKFQQKQMQAREQRKIEMTGERSSDSSETSVPSKVYGNGKVRQMFDERRRGAGIDRSNPLKPIMGTASKSSTNSTGSLRNNAAAPIRRQAAAMSNSQANGRRNLGRSGTFDKSVSSSSNRVQHEANSENDTLSKSFTSLSLVDHRTSANEFGDRARGDITRGQSSNSIKLKPVLTKKSPLASSTRNLHVSASPPVSASIARTQRTETDSSSNSPRKFQTSTVKTLQKSSVRKMSVNKVVDKQPLRTGPPPPGMATCRICHRNFNEDRLAKHEQVCLKMANSKRKIFDASKARVKGTEAEKYLKKPIRSSTTTTTSSSSRPTYSSSTAAAGTPTNSGLKKNNWRKKHEEFIAAIRAAKQVQVHLAKGGKLKDLPPPPPSENPDYIQCPHCSRRFNQAAAERHIPKCATMLHNKPKPGVNNKRKS